MKSPFQFGKVVLGGFFVNRTEELQRLRTNFSSGINTVLLSPRRYGKSSLVRQAALTMKNEPIRFVFIDLFSIRSEEDFYKIYAQQVLKATLTKQSEFLSAAKDFFKKIIPVLSFSVDPQHDLSIGFNWEQAKQSKDEILNLPERIAQKKGYRVVVCIDEFQNINLMQQALHIEKELRSVWQHHQNVSYCLYGSKRHMIRDIFSKEERPFYRFGDMFSINRIERQHWVKFICDAFAKTGKNISHDLAALIAQRAENHPYYVQQLSHTVWGITADKATEEILELAVEQVANTNAIFYKEQVDSLSNTQIAMLYAALDGVHQFTSQEAMSNYRMGTLNNITKNKAYLESRDILEFGEGETVFVDPFFKLWIAKNTN